MAFEWFPCFDAIPGVVWESLAAIRRSELPGVDARPLAEERALSDGRPYRQVEWLTPGGSKLSSEPGSPAQLYQRRLEADRDLAPHKIVKTVSEVLALPGTRSDYQYGMVWAWQALDSARRRDSRAFGWIEALCLADVSLMEQGPERVFAGDELRYGYQSRLAFAELAGLYQREGFLDAAAGIEMREAALNGTPAYGTAIAGRAALLEEDGR